MKQKYTCSLKNARLRGRLSLLTGLLVLVASSLFAQKTYDYSGTVSDKQGETLPGVNVVIKGTTVGVLTDIQGHFKLSSQKAEEVLVFSFIGFTKQEVAAKAGVPLKVTLESSNTVLSEVVVIGYGVQKKSVVTGAISQVKAGELKDMPIPRIEQALQGRATGLTIANSSGQPGAASTVRVRGTTTINNSNPLYVVDGLPIDNGGIDYLNSDDIESIEVLKDAASAAIYGTRAASGVILVTTKKGKKGTGAGVGGMQVTFNSYIGTQAPAKKLDLLNATDYATLRNEASVNSGGPVIFANPQSFGEGTDWQSTIFNNSAGISNYELSVSGGNDKSTFYTSMGYFQQEGVVASSISNYKRLNLRFNSNHKVNEWLRFGNNIGYSHIKSQGSLNTNSEYGGPLSSAINLDPITPTVITDTAITNYAPYNSFPVVKDNNGTPYGISPYVQQEMTNPLAYIKTRQGNYGWSDNLVGNIFAEIEPIKGLKIKSDIGAKLAFYGDESFSPIAYLNAASYVTNNSFYRANNQGLIWNWENTAAYTKTIGKHNGTIMVGTSAYVENSSGANVTYKNLPVNTFEEASMNYNIIAGDRVGGGWESADHKVSSIYSRLIYNYDEKYLFTGIIRRDGSSRFGSNNRYGIFPSASLGWVTSKEGFWPRNNVLTFLKIRGSYGVNGNDNIGDFKYLSLVEGGRNYTLGADNYVVGYSPKAPANPDLKWEQTSQLNIGFEASLFQDLTLVFDWYSKNTTGILGDIVLPGYVGTAGNPTGNVASMTNKGVELELGYKRKVGQFDLGFSGNVSYLKNEITDLGDVDFLSGATFQSSSYEISRMEVGHSIGSFYGFDVLSVFQSVAEIQHYKDENGNMIQPNAKPGDFQFADLNNDGKIDANDRKFIGDPTPKWSYGFTINAAYKGFDLVIFCQGVAGNDIFNGLRRLDMPTANWTSDALDRWTGKGTSNDYPRLVLGDPNKNFSSPSTFFLSSGSYLRFKTVQLGYTLKKDVIKKIGLQNLRFYVSTNNLLTFTKYKGYDPEIGGSSYGIDRGVYPQARSFMVGLSVTF